MWIIDHKRAVSSTDRCRWLSLYPGKIASKFAAVVVRDLERSHRRRSTAFFSSLYVRIANLWGLMLISEKAIVEIVFSKYSK